MRHSLLIRVTHWINTLAFFALIVSGAAILIAHPRFYWGETGAFGSPALIELPLPLNLDQSGWGRSLHFLAAWICLLNGTVYVLSGLVRRHFTAAMPATYDTSQRLAYVGVVFVALPIMIVSGLAMSPAVTAALPITVRIFGGYQSARMVHFIGTGVLLLFVTGHLAMIYLAGFRNRVREMILAGVAGSPSRRRFIIGASAAGAAALLFRRYGLVPPDHSGVLGVGHTITYTGQRLLLRRQPLAREFRRDQISTNFPAINTTLPEDNAYRRDMIRGFSEWRLTVGGLVARPSEISLAQLRSFPSRTQITQHVCEQGWSAIAEWTGVPLSVVLNAVGVLPQARYVFFNCVDGWWDSLDMADAWHPQTLLAYGMNGGDLSVAHGAPVRLRVERQIGYKNLKYLSSITITDTAEDWGKGKGSQGAENGYCWYAGI